MERKSRFSAARMKKLMQDDEDVGKLAASVPHTMGLFLESFGADLVARAAAIAQQECSSVLQVAHIKKCVQDNHVLLKFLQETVDNAHLEVQESGCRSKASSSSKRKQSVPSSTMVASSEEVSISAAIVDGSRILPPEPLLYDHSASLPASRLLDDEDEDYD